MKQQVYKNLIAEIALRLHILKASIVYTFQIETAYVWNNWGNMVSTIAFVSMQLLFLEVIYANVDLVAGYTRDEMLFFFLMSQAWFYAVFSIFHKNLLAIISSVLSGELDLLLTKPIPSLFYVSLRRINVYSTLRDGILPMSLVVLIIDWSQINFEIINFIIGIVILSLGIFITNFLQFFACVASFWMGDTENLVGTEIELEYSSAHQFPFEGWNKFFQILFTVVFPSLISVGLSTSVILGKMEPFIPLLISILVFSNLRIIQHFVWKKALKNYSSASS